MLVSFAVLAALLVPGAAGSTPPSRHVLSQPSTISFFGINGYFSGYERSSGEVNTLLPLGPAIGMVWTREEIVWANIETSQDDFDFGHYDDLIGRMANAGYGIIGMLLTTPAWARKSACSGSYWCPPASVWDYSDFVARTVERYDGDGVGDAPGSPRVAYWEIWNEPNYPQTWWPNGYSSEAEREAAYGDLLHVGYQAVKAVDPTAQVLVGSVYTWDGASYPPPVYDGLAWLGQVMVRHPDLCNDFDIMAIHPHMPDVAPDKPGLGSLITMIGRMDNALRWDSDHGCAEKPVWVTEVGWSTCTGCGSWAKTEDQQANYLLRTYALAAGRGIAHVGVFQLEDKFDGGASDTWGNCSIIRTAAQGYAQKKAYHALEVMIEQIGGFTSATAGDWNDEPNRFDYRFNLPDGDVVDVLWRPNEQNETISFGVLPNYQVSWVQRDGQVTPLTPANGYVSITINGTPGYLHQERPPILAVSPYVLGWVTLPGDMPPEQLVYLTNQGGGTLNWTAAVVTGTQYYTVEPTSGTAPATLTIRATAPLSYGYFGGQVRVDGGAAGQSVVWLWLMTVPTLWKVHLPLVSVDR
jgi:hypothetical protein